MDILPEPCKWDNTHSWSDDATETGASESNHAAAADDNQKEHATLRHLQGAKQLEAEMDDALGTFWLARHTQR